MTRQVSIYVLTSLFYVPNWLSFHFTTSNLQPVLPIIVHVLENEIAHELHFMVSSIRCTSPTLATDIGTLIKCGVSAFQYRPLSLIVHVMCDKEPQTGSQEISSSEAGMEYRAVSCAVNLCKCGGFGVDWCWFA